MPKFCALQLCRMHSSYIKLIARALQSHLMCPVALQCFPLLICAKSRDKRRDVMLVLIVFCSCCCPKGRGGSKTIVKEKRLLLCNLNINIWLNLNKFIIQLIEAIFRARIASKMRIKPSFKPQRIPTVFLHL